MDHFAAVNGIKLHYLDHPGGAPLLVLLPGLTANAHCFDGLIQAGLSPRFRVLALDLRGRGLSDQPATGYGMAEHAQDVTGLLDALGIERAVIGGHSFGGLLTFYLAARHPERVAKAIILDAAGPILNPQTAELIRPAVERLGKTLPSWEAYLEMMKRAPHFDGWWDPAIESYFRADVETDADGAVRPRSRPEHIAEAMRRAGAENWNELIAAVTQPALLLYAPGPYGPPGTPPIVPAEHAQATAEALARCRAAEVPGNHMTMLFGEGARRIVARITEFLSQG
jgi:pimeloyl-ACP methyl ester carboxylesterase